MSLSVQVIKPCGILGQTQAKQFRQEVSDLLDAGVIEILIDFGQVTFMDSAGLGALINVLKTVRAADRVLSLCSLRQEVKMLLELADVVQFFTIFSDQEAFYQARENYSST